MLRLLFAFMVIMMTAGTSMAENVSPCSVDSVPIKIIYGERPSPVTTLSAATFSSGDPALNTFITTVTKHLAAKLAQEKLCLDSAESKERSLIQFVYMPLAVPTANPILPPVPSPGVCRLSSPWIDITIARGPAPSVQAVVRFNERQLLADQAVLAGARDVPLGVAMPLTGEEYARYLSAYLYAAIDYHLSDIPLEKSVEELVPPDFFWLLTHATQTNEMFSGEIVLAMRHAMETSAESYTKIVTSLIDLCFASDGADMQFGSVLDVADLVPLEQYKMDMLYGERPTR